MSAPAFDLMGALRGAVGEENKKLLDVLPGIVRDIVRAELERLQRKPQPLCEILNVKPETARKREFRDKGLKALAVGKHGRRRLYFSDDVHAYLGRGGR